ncbi:MAG: DUF3999 family protein, partial [Verrucomicrobia bacterium]|nr:DUF3999 family protein [Verrucomicrobiota bacterium]
MMTPLNTSPSRRRPWPLAAVIALFMIHNAAGRTGDAQPYPFQRNLIPNDPGHHDMGAVDLDEHILAHLDESAANLRVLDSRGREVPVLVSPKRGIQRRKQEYTISYKHEGFRLRQDNAVEIVLHPTNTLDQPIAIRFSSQQRNFEKQVSVWGSHNGNEWEAVVTNEPIFDYSRFMDIRNDRVALPGAHHRHYLVVVGNMSEAVPSPLTEIARERNDEGFIGEIEKQAFNREDFRIDRVILLGERMVDSLSDTETRAYDTSDFRIEQRDDTRTTELYFSLPSIPLTEVQIAIDGVNFSRAYTLDAMRTDGWRRLTSGTLSLIRTDRYRRNQSRIVLPRTARYANYRLTIHNQDNPVLDVTGLHARGEIHQALFFTESEQQYQLVYGGE